MSFIIKNTDLSLDNNYLYNSLGSFWTQIFQEKQFIRGYTLGMAEELAQQYINLAEVVNSYSIKDIPVYHKEKWYPLFIRKSLFNKSAFVFEKNSAVFGAQPANDRFFAGDVFRFGFPKENENFAAYSFTPAVKLKNLSCLNNRLIDPSYVFISGIDYVFKNNTIYFNQDIFDNEYFPKFTLLQDDGNLVTYIDSDGRQQQEEVIVAWANNVDIDYEELYNNFGVIYDFKLDSSEKYKAILQALINISVEGSTVAAIKTFLSNLLEFPTIIETKETVENIYSDDYWKYLVTDKHVYRLKLSQNIVNSIKLGDILYAGDFITDDAVLADSAISSNWWLKEIDTDKLAFAPNVFAADVKNQLFFENKNLFIEYRDNQLFFPVIGSSKDVESFHKYINLENNKNTLLEKLNFVKDNSFQSKSINPLEFVFNNFFKNNTLFIKLAFYSDRDLNNFFDLLPLFKKYFTSHIYILIFINFKISSEEFSSLNNGLNISGFSSTFSMDGSVSLTGARPEKEGGDLNYYKDYTNRLFCISISPSKDVLGVATPLHSPENLESLALNSPSGISCGTLRTVIPEFITPPGESGTRRPSNREIPGILLMDF